MGNCLITRRGGISGGGGGASGYYWKVMFFNRGGSELLNTEYVENGEDCLYGIGINWNTSPNQNEGISGITNNVSNNLTLYQVLQGPSQTERIMSKNEFYEFDCSSQYDSSRKPDYLFDGEKNTSYMWTTAPGDNTPWVSAKFKNPCYISRVRVYANTYPYDPSFIVYGLTSEGTWENCMSPTTQSGHYYNGTVDPNCEITLNQNAYYGIKIEWSGPITISGGSGQFSNLTEVEVYSY